MVANTGCLDTIEEAKAVREALMLEAGIIANHAIVSVVKVTHTVVSATERETV